MAQHENEGAENGCGVSQDFHPLDINMEEEADEQGVEPVFRPQEAELVHRQQVSPPSSIFRCTVSLISSGLPFPSVRLQREE